MKKDEVIRRLNDLIADRKSFIYQGGDNEEFEKEIEALEESIKLIEAL